MKLEITAESVASAVYISWSAAHEADTHSKWLDWWGGVEKQLKGIWNVVNWSRGKDQDKEAASLMDDIEMLRTVANEIRFSWREK